MAHKKLFVFRHKFAIIFFVAVLIGGAWFYGNRSSASKKEPRYVLASASMGTVSVSVSGSGQVSLTNQVDMKPKTSGTLLALKKTGDTIQEGEVIARLDTKDARKSIRDAEESLQSARLSLEKMKKPADTLAVLQSENALSQARRDLQDMQEPPDELAILQAENALAQSREANEKAIEELQRAYDDGFNDVANAFLDLPTIKSGLEDMLFRATIDKSQWNIDWYVNQAILWETDSKARGYKNDVTKAYEVAKSAYDANFLHYKEASRSSDAVTIENLIAETYATARAFADAVKTTNNYVDYVQDVMQDHSAAVPAAVTTHQNSLDAHTSKTNTHVSDLLAAKIAIPDKKTAITNAKRSIAEKTDALKKLNEGPEKSALSKAQELILEREESLKKLKKGADPLDIKLQELTIAQRSNALGDAREKLEDYVLRAPFRGLIANMDAKIGDTISPSTVLGMLITKQRLAELTLNEVDIAKVVVGQRAVLTFDALPDLTISGVVAAIDTIGASSQGVVSYTVNISFDTQDERVRPGMSISASIITDVRLNVLTVPNAALKTQGSQTSVETVDRQQNDVSQDSAGVLLSTRPVKRVVEVGLANDEVTEIRSGLARDDVVVVSTINDISPAVQQQPGIRIPGLPGGGSQGGGFGRGGGQR